MESKSQISPHIDRFEDEESSSLEDYDSEWTQVSGAEDDSDYPPLTAASDRPLSRAGTADGSIDGDIWEGFIDATHSSSSQVSIRSRPAEVDATIETPPDTGVLEPPVDSEDREEEVTAESSFTGTLRASHIRSASSSLQASMTDSQSKLRLSFPDPLSSREDLDAGPVTHDLCTPPNLTEDRNESVIAGDGASSFAPLGYSASKTPDEVIPPALTIPTSAAYILALFLYGSTTTAKWNIVDRIVAQLFGNDTLTVVNGVSQRTYYFDRVSHRVNLGGTEHGFYIRVFDRTSSFSEESPDDNDRSPSVAILLLPSSLPADLPRHDFYLPLISTAPLGYGSPGPKLASTLSAQITADSASYTWSKLDLPKERVIVLDKQKPHVIMDASALRSIDASTLCQAFSVAFGKADAELNSPSIRGVQKLFHNKWHALAFFATSLLAVTVGGIQINRSATSVLAPANITVDGGVFSLGTTSSLMHAIAPVTSLALATQSEPRSLTNLDARTTECSTSGLVDRNIGSSKSTDAPSSVSIRSIATAASQIHDDRRSKARSWIDRVNFSLGEYIPRDLIVWPVDTICFNGGRTSSSRDSASAIKSLSLRTVQNSVTVVSSKGKALKETAEKDMLMIHEAIDELLRALGRQMNIATEDLKDASIVAQSGFSFRNARARENARRLRHVGEYFVKTTGNRLRSKGEGMIKMASQVREGARAIRQEAVNLHRSRRSGRRQDRRNVNKRPEVTSDQVDSEEKGQTRETDRVRNSKHHDRRMRRSRSEL